MQVNAATVTIIVGICSISAFFIGQYAGVRKSGYEQGLRDAKINSMNEKLEVLTNEIKEWNMGALIQRVTALEKEIYKQRKEEDR